jgi:hypothetical protein
MKITRQRRKSEEKDEELVKTNLRGSFEHAYDFVQPKRETLQEMES